MNKKKKQYNNLFVFISSSICLFIGALNFIPFFFFSIIFYMTDFNRIAFYLLLISGFTITYFIALFIALFIAPYVMYIYEFYGK